MASPIPVCLTVAGSDSGGGAGIQADLRTFSWFGVYGASVITCITAQNPRAVTGVHAVPAAMVEAQLQAVCSCYRLAAVKTGMLFNAAIINTVTAGLKRCSIPVVVDPVMVATSGARLLRDTAITTLVRRLLPCACLITPNRPEAEVLLGRPLSPGDEIDAARELQQRFGPILLKGGHAQDPGTDLLALREGLWQLCSPALTPPETHGTGCTLSSAVAANLALGQDLLSAVIGAKALVWASLQNPRGLGPGVAGLWPPERIAPETIIVRRLS